MTQSDASPEPAGGEGGSRRFVLKHGDMFLVADAVGNVSDASDGLFYNDTRILSTFVLTLGGRPPSLLGAAVSQDDITFQANLTNKPLPPIGGTPTPEGIIHVERTRLLWRARLYERVRVTNYGRQETPLSMQLRLGADFHDMFEVRGVKRSRRGTIAPPSLEARSIAFGYVGLDGVSRACVASFSREPSRLGADGAAFDLALAPGGVADLHLEIGVEAAPPPTAERFADALRAEQLQIRGLRETGATIETSGRVFDEWTGKARADIALLTTEFDTGPYPYAGIPWFSTAFGRDAIITALQMLWLDPSLARGVLAYLAKHQATETSKFFDAAPGKIMHETRKGEMVTLGELPFARYYGGVDTTPLFVLLAGAYAARTADLAFIEDLWPALLAAMAWVEGDGDTNRDGFLDYARGADTGLANQGWKDSEDSVFHADGSDVVGPIALVEVQGYAFAALGAMGDLCGRRGRPDEAAAWTAKAERLRAAVEDRFWMDDLGTYAEALDGAGRPCRVQTSNPGHLLFCGLPSPERARLVTAKLMDPIFNSGWGIRTLAEGESRYNPMSYHNGSIWPHDTSISAAGMARYGARDEVASLLSDSFEAAVKFEMRLPELMCGFERRAGEPPVGYPVACRPQAWASGSGFMMLQACLGLRVDAWANVVHVTEPRLPHGVERLTLRRLAIGERWVDITFQRTGDRVAVYPEGVDASSLPILLHS